MKFKLVLNVCFAMLLGQCAQASDMTLQQEPDELIAYFSKLYASDNEEETDDEEIEEINKWAKSLRFGSPVTHVERRADALIKTCKFYSVMNKIIANKEKAHNSSSSESVNQTVMPQVSFSTQQESDERQSTIDKIITFFEQLQPRKMLQPMFNRSVRRPEPIEIPENSQLSAKGR